MEIGEKHPHVEIVEEHLHMEIGEEHPHVEIGEEHLLVEIGEERPRVEIGKEHPVWRLVKSISCMEIGEEHLRVEIGEKHVTCGDWGKSIPRVGPEAWTVVYGEMIAFSSASCMS